MTVEIFLQEDCAGTEVSDEILGHIRGRKKRLRYAMYSCIV